MGAVLRLIAHGGLGGLAVEVSVVIGLVVLVAAIVVQGRKEAQREKERGAAEAAPREDVGPPAD